MSRRGIGLALGGMVGLRPGFGSRLVDLGWLCWWRPAGLG